MKEFKLNTSPKIESGFKMPDAIYFEKFSANILEQLPKNEPKTISLFQRNKTIISLVAAVFVLALVIPSVINNTNHTNDIDAVTLENYLSYQSNMNQYDLLNVLDEEDIEGMNTNTDIHLENETIEEILVTNNNLEHYIIE